MKQHVTMLRLTDEYGTVLNVAVMSFNKLTELDITEVIREHYPATESYEIIAATKNIVHI